MKHKLRSIVPCFILLLLFVYRNFEKVNMYYSGLESENGVQEDFETKLREENLNSLEERKYLPDYMSETEITDQTASEEYDIKLHAASCLLMDAENNRVLYEENGQKELSMASTTKIMTCIVTLENANLKDIVTVSSYAARMPDVQLNIRSGEQYYLMDLLHSLMLESHNDVAVAIAEHVGGSVEGFATMMNDKARSLGCDNTNFVTPNGLDAEGHYTTAQDLAVITSYAIKNDKFINITNTPSYQFKELINGRSFSVSNKNKFLYMMEGAIGVKTGFTGEAGYCFVGAIKRPDRTLVSVVLGCGWPPHKSLKWSDTKELMNYGIKNYEKKQIYEDITLDPIFIQDGQQSRCALRMEGDLPLLLREDETIHIVYEIPEILTAPIKAEEIAGYAKYYIDDMLYRELPVYTTESIKKIDYPFCLKQLFHIWSLDYE